MRSTAAPASSRTRAAAVPSSSHLHHRRGVAMEQREKLYEGKAKIVYATDRPGTVIQYFKDDATAFNALKRGTILGKGVVNNRMSAVLFERRAKSGIPTHLLSVLADRRVLCHPLDIIK